MNQINEMVCEYQKTKCSKILGQIIKANEGHLWNVSRKYANSSNIKDCVSEGKIAICAAALKFNSNIGVSFITYAIWHIRARIMRYIQSDTTVKLPAQIAMSAFSKASKNNKESMNMLKNARKTENIEWGDGESKFAENEIEDDLGLDVELLLKNLTSNEKLHLKQFFGIGVEKRTLSEIGEQNGISKEGARLRIKKIQEKIRNSHLASREVW